MADMPSTSLKLVLLLLLLQICSSYILLERSPRVTVKEGPFLLERYNSDDPGAFVEIATEPPSKIQAVTHLKDDPPSSSMEKVSAKADAKLTKEENLPTANTQDFVADIAPTRTSQLGLVSKPKLERAPSSEPEQPEHQIVPEPEPLPESEPILTPEHDSPNQDATEPSSESDIEPSSEAEPNVEKLAYKIENSMQDMVDETTEPSPVEGALGEILDEIYAEPVDSLEPSEELKMTHQVENAFLEKLSHILPSIVNNFEKIGGSSAGGERAIVGEVRKKVTIEVEGEDDRVLIAKLQFALSFEEPKTDVVASATASSEQPESSGHQHVEVESESTTQNPPSSSTEMSKPSEALPQPEPPLYPQEHLQHQHDPLFAYFPGGHPLLGLTQVVISPQGEQNHILPPPSFPQVPQGHPQLHPHGGFAHPLLDLTHVAIQTNGLYPNMEYLLHPQDSYHPHGLVHLPHNDQGHPLVKPALHQGADTATRWAGPGLGGPGLGPGLGEPPAMFFPPAVFQGHKQPLGPHTSVKGL